MTLRCATATAALSGLLLLWASASWAEPVRWQGPVVQGGLLIGQAPPGSQVSFDGVSVAVSEDGQFLFGFGRDHDQASELVVTLPSGEPWRRTLKPDSRDFDIQRIDGLPDNMVTPPAETLARIRREAELARAVRANPSDRTDWTEGFVWPLSGRISGVYGSQRILNGQPRAPHWGLDIAAPTGTPVRAPAGGEVRLIHPDMYFSGGTIFLDHGHGLISSFLHLSEILVERGQIVKQGQIIGQVGATGRATGPHLDWRISWHDVRVDPQLLLPDQQP
jgi:murein DD-endopeptidase MepM/ murein hydrolase activator NlpD